MTELQNIESAINNALNFLKNQDLSEVGRQTQGKLIYAKTQVENLILNDFLFEEDLFCECGGNKRVGLDCTSKPCKHPNYKQ